jgi:hypothetical protein
MRNKVLAEALVKEGAAEWSHFAVCSHPSNDTGSTETIREFHSLFGNGELLRIDPNVLISATVDSDRRLKPWAEYMQERYGL